MDVLRWRAHQRPEHCTYTFLPDGGTFEVTLTDAELDERARAVAAVLRERRLRGERALLVYPPGLELVAAIFGCLYAGTVAVLTYPPDPLRLDRTLPRLMSIVADARPSVLLTTSLVSEMSESVFGGAAELMELPRLATDGIEWEAAGEWRDPGVRKSDLALFQYTSGSTAEPRGVMLTHENVLDNLRRIRSCFGMTSESHVLSWLPPYHDMGLVGGILEGLYISSKVTLMSPADFLQRPARWLQAISRTGAKVSGGPNFAYDLCARKITPDELAGLELGSWEVAFNGAEPVRPETLKRFAEVFAPAGFRSEAFLPCYGLAESSLIVAGGLLPPATFRRYTAALETDGTDPPVTPLVSCGRPIDGHRVVVVDPQRRTLCAPGEQGEIWVAGPSVAAGYWDRPQESAQVFAATLADGDGPFLRTGDLGFFRDGELHLTSRLKDLIVVRGRNIHPQDVERTVDDSHPAVRPGSGAAFGVEAEGSERLVVVQEVRGDGTVPLEEVAAGIRTAVTTAHEVRPYAVVLVEARSIPKTSSGKIQRSRTRDSFLAGTLRVLAELRDTPLPETAAPPPGQTAGNGVTPLGRQAIEDWLTAEVARSGGVDPDRIEVEEPFAVHGIDSASGVALAGDLEKLLGISLPPTLTWDYPSIAALAEHLAAVVAGPDSHQLHHND